MIVTHVNLEISNNKRAILSERSCLRSHSRKRHLECFHSIHFELICTCQIAFAVICCFRLSIWTVISIWELSITVAVTVVIYANITSTAYHQQVWCIVILVCVFCIVNFEYVLVIELNDKCIFIFNIFLMLWWLLLLLEISSECSIVLWVDHV
jgi:hypothetical protein